MRNEAIRSPYHIVGSTEIPNLETELPWYVRFGLFIGTLMTQPANPKGWSWNPSVITLCILIAGILTGGGWYIGHQQAVLENLQKDSEQTRGIAEKAKGESGYAVARVDGGDGHAAKATPTPKKDKKVSEKSETGE